jgi:hypothetical protein
MENYNMRIGFGDRVFGSENVGIVYKGMLKFFAASCMLNL